MFCGLKDSDDPDDLIRLAKVADALFLAMTDSDLVDQYYDELFDLLDINVESEEVVHYPESNI